MLYKDNYYQFDYTTSFRNRINIKILNVIQNPNDSKEQFIAADFDGVVYTNTISGLDSAIINGEIRFK